MRFAAFMFIAVMCAGAALAGPVKHGREIEPSNTGPSAAGYHDLQPADGGEIKDGRTYSFARAVAQTATYDGFEVSGPHLLIEGMAFTRPLDISISQRFWKHWSARFAVRNVLDPEFVRTYGSSPDGSVYSSFKLAA